LENFGQSLSDLEHRRAPLSRKLSGPPFVPTEPDAESKASVRTEHLEVYFSGGHIVVVLIVEANAVTLESSSGPRPPAV